jgi:alkanesulfonate monooxygenase SsuD/methylene tetrahydromethanopterin reductase-like flavin-dependent oxidoreductase (luciferase family)
VLVLPWHNPALLAEQAATLDLFSNGRLEFGAYRASIQVFEPTSLTATFEKKRCSGSPLRVPR